MNAVSRKTNISVGERVEFAKTVAESDVYLFAGITGDFAPVHVNEVAMKDTAFGHRIAHGVLIVGFMSTAVSLIVKDRDFDGGATPVSLGYDRIRFIKPVFFGDTITIRYEVISVDLEKQRAMATVHALNQRDELVCAAEHILRWV
jgi:acyl dehydratase